MDPRRFGLFPGPRRACADRPFQRRNIRCHPLLIRVNVAVSRNTASPPAPRAVETGSAKARATTGLALAEP